MDFLAVQWLRFCLSNTGGMGLISDQGTEIPHSVQYSQNKNSQSTEICEFFFSINLVSWASDTISESCQN